MNCVIAGISCELVQTIASVLALVGIILLWLQIKSDLKWKKLSYTIDIIDESFLRRILTDIRDGGIDLSKDDMDDAEYNKLIDPNNHKLRSDVQDLLDMCDKFAQLYNRKLLNETIARALHGGTIIFHYNRFKKVIEYYQKQNPLYYKEFVKCAEHLMKPSE